MMELPLKKALAGSCVGCRAATKANSSSLALSFDSDSTEYNHPDENVHDGSEKDAANELANRSSFRYLGDKHAYKSNRLKKIQN